MRVADPYRAVAENEDGLLELLRDVLRSGRYVMGPEHDAFEAEFATYLDIAHCLGVGSGTDAIELALRALGCGRGDEVVCVANAGMYASAAVVAVGATPVFIDIDARTLLVDVRLLSGAIRPSTTAVVVTHLFGLAADIETVVSIAQQAGIAVVEDCAQAAGARVAGNAVGTFGDVGAFSFYPTKNLGALGDGGAVTTNRADLAARVAALRQYGWIRRFEAVTPGGRNSRLDELQAAILRRRLPHLDDANARRRWIVERYCDAVDRRAEVVFAPGESFVGHLAVVRHPRRDALRAALERRGTPTDIHYPIPDHCQPALAGLFRVAGGLDVTERASTEVLSVPCFPQLTDVEVEKVCSDLRDALREVDDAP
jgi:dTDP-4-amino-4,6-dideoxygalactose transaminase